MQKSYHNMESIKFYHLHIWKLSRTQQLKNRVQNKVHAQPCYNTKLDVNLFFKQKSSAILLQVRNLICFLEVPKKNKKRINGNLEGNSKGRLFYSRSMLIQDIKRPWHARKAKTRKNGAFLHGNKESTLSVLKPN